MENNRYAQHKQEIDRISREEGVDVGLACAKLRDRMGWTFDGPDKELTGFTGYINELARKAKTPEGLTEWERMEQAALRREYIDSVLGNLKSQLDHTYVVDDQGNKRKLKQKED